MFLEFFLYLTRIWLKSVSEVFPGSVLFTIWTKNTVVSYFLLSLAGELTGKRCMIWIKIDQLCENIPYNYI